MRRLGVVVVAVAMLMAMAIPGALAVGGGKPVLQEHFDDQFVEEPDAFVFSSCGVEVRTEFHFWGHSTTYADMSSRIHVNTDITYVDPDSGKVLLVERNAFNVYRPFSAWQIDEEAGTVTATFETTTKGVPFRWLIPGEGVIILDAGTVTFTQVVVSDLVTGDLISVEEFYSNMHGPHPSLTETGWAGLFCEALQA